AIIDVMQGPTGLKPDIVMTMSADTANLFWNKKVNLMSALAKGQIKLQGSQIKVLSLLPAIEPLYGKYRQLLKDKGLDHLIVP
ncbi:MAG: SCP2 sterol-binding domain-containing protein, partial [Anaerolineae bacterium]|nr:SCP2 sterol-binding domain-containing protein [Anaerolineae bacterium]